MNMFDSGINPDDLIADHLGLAHSLAQQVWRTAPHALELDELKAIATLGLVGASRRWHDYCAENDYSPRAVEYFKPFASRRIYGSLIDEIRRADWATRSLRTRAKLLQAAGQDNGATDAELAERTGLTVPEVRATIRGMAQKPVPLESDGCDPTENTDVESSVVAQSLLDVAVNVIRTLPGEQQVVVALHYHKGFQLQEVAKMLGITESRASQLHARAVLVVHEAMRDAAVETGE